jgi:hypothetical protein
MTSHPVRNNENVLTTHDAKTIFIILSDLANVTQTGVS